MSDGALLDLVCGPASPLPETHQRYRLVAHLGSGGQAEVYRAVRLCGGVTSAPMTVKVFRVDPQRPLVDELRSWDKGDAALMDLNNRGVTGICRRADGFYGPPPHRPGEPAPAGEAVPYQIYDYLHGINLRQYIAQRAGMQPGARRLNAVATLRTVAGILRALHLPQEAGATPVLHMDIKPANLMVLTNGEVRLIDFTGARYWRVEEITQIAYTPESGGPEAFDGARSVGPAYDVHGFGAVAYYLITGAYPRVDASGSTPVGADRAVLRRHPLLERAPALRDHLHAPLADRPGDRPVTAELEGWVADLAALAHRSGVPDVGVDWSEPDRAESARAVGRAAPRPPVTGTETEAFQHIERLERELVALRASVGGLGQPARAGGAPASGLPPTRLAPGGPGVLVGSGVPGFAAAAGFVSAPGSAGAPWNAGTPGAALAPPAYAGVPVSPGGPVSPGAQGAARGAGQMRGRAKVPPPRPLGRRDQFADPLPEQQEPWRPPARASRGSLRRGWKLSGTGAGFAFVCWGVWAASNRGRLATPALTFAIVLAVAAGVFLLARLVGRLVLEQRMGRVRHTARGSHAVTGLFLVVAGVAYLRQTVWVIDAYTWLTQHVQ